MKNLSVRCDFSLSSSHLLSMTKLELIVTYQLRRGLYLLVVALLGGLGATSGDNRTVFYYWFGYSKTREEIRER